ncbi:mycothiol transferase [Pseudonocardia sp.]|uniref:mycothiol transferase n=1 Tax=Pseudonocardia sp. TaxID=60912 RepID=UPI003D117FD1
MATVTAAADLLIDALGRVRENAHHVVGELSAEQLAYRVDGRGNPIGWLVWHLARVADDHLSEAAGVEQRWTAAGWAQRFGREPDPEDTGYGHTTAQVAAFRSQAAELHGYVDAVLDESVAFLRGLSDADLERIVDERWDPPVTLAVRLVSVVDDAAQHVGQAAYVRGLLPG